jgi:hypothetical protein
MQGGTANGFASWHPNLKHFALEVFSGDVREGHRQDTLGVGSFFKQTSNAPFKAKDFPVPGPATTRTNRSAAEAIPYAGDCRSRLSSHAMRPHAPTTRRSVLTAINDAYNLLESHVLHALDARRCAYLGSFSRCGRVLRTGLS